MLGHFVGLIRKGLKRGFPDELKKPLIKKDILRSMYNKGNLHKKHTKKLRHKKSESLYAARKRVKKVKYEEGKKSERNSDTLKECNTKKSKMKKVHHEEKMRSERNKKKRVQ